MSELVPVITPSLIDVSCAQYLDFCKQYLYTGSHEIRDKLSAAITDIATSFTLTFGNQAFQPNTRVSCELEDMFVWACADGKTITNLDRGQFGTVPTSHPINATVYASPKFSDAEILREINRAIQSLSSPGGLYAIGTVDITTTTSARAYELEVANAFDILDIRVRVPGDTLTWHVVNDWQYEQRAGSDFASGNAIFINDPLPSNTTLHITYSYPFAPLSALSDLVFPTTGLSLSQYDLPLLSASIALTAGREIKRNWTESQGQTRRAEEVGPGANLSSSNALRAQFRQRYVEEANRLSKMFPNRKRRMWDLV